MANGNNPETDRSIKAKWRSDRPSLAWSSSTASALVDAIEQVTLCGHAILLARPNDGRSLVVQVLNNADKPKYHIDLASDIDACLKWIADTYR